MRIIPLFFLAILAVPARSQQKDAYYMLDAKWNPTTNKDSAKFFIRVRQLNDTSWQWDYYNVFGPLVKSERYRDKDGNVQHGRSFYYDGKGLLDSTTEWRNNKRNGDSYRFTGDSLKMRFKYVYRDDSLIELVDVFAQKHDTSTKYPDEKESEFPGGVAKWIRYLNKNLRYPDRALNSSIEGDVRIEFIVDKDGNVIEPIVARSVEWSLDDESITIIKESGKWTPAFQNGRIVKSYKIQPVVYRLR
jgi:periplasmic protein TonB